MISSGFDRNKLILKYPSTWYGNKWREALPSGNGKIGASVYGGIQKEIILLNHEELWYGGKREKLPDVSYTLKEVRKQMSEGNYKEADGLLSNALHEKGYNPKAASPLPFADLKINMPINKGFKNYSRCLNMETGEVGVSWEDGTVAYERILFVSRADDVVVYEIRSSTPLVNAQFNISMHDMEDSYRNFMDEKVINSCEIKAEGQNMFYAVQNDDGTDFGAVIRIVTLKGELEVQNNGIHVKRAASVLVLVKLFVKGKRQKDWERLKKELDTIDSDYKRLLDDHIYIHKPLFNSVSLNLDSSDSNKSNEELLLEAYNGQPSLALIEKMWAMGRYLLISSTRSEGLVCALYGLWCGDYYPQWCQNVANENIEMIYWHSLIGGLSELMCTVFNYYDDLMDDSRENAAKLFGCKGINVHTYTSPGIGIANILVPVILNWTGASGWIAKFYYDYYTYTGDMRFLKKRALPFMRETAMFYKDFYVTDQDGYLLSYPSVSPENSPGKFCGKDDPMTHPLPTTINATMDFAIMKELLKNLINTLRITGEYTCEISEWEEMLSKIPPYQINEDGAIKEWMHSDFDDHYNHRHLSHLYPIFPGQEIFKECNPELFEACKKAVEKRLIVGLSDQTGWSLTHMAAIYARLGEGDLALECLELLSRSCLMNNFLTLHNDWRNMGITVEHGAAPFQIDANMGFTNAVQEMLLYVSPEIIKILPSLPSRMIKGEVKKFRFCTGRISFSWDIDKNKFNAQIYAERDTQVLLKLPRQFNKYIITDKDSCVSSSVDENICINLIIKSGKNFSIEAV